MILILKKFLIQAFSLLPDKLLEKLEKIFSISRGRGYNFSIESEFKNFLRFNKNIRVFVDIGGNRGKYTDQIIKNFPSSKGFIFEPDSTNYFLLKKNINLIILLLLIKPYLTKQVKNFYIQIKKVQDDHLYIIEE